MVGPPCLHGNHCSRVSLTLESKVPSSRKSSQDGVQLPMDRYLMSLVPRSNLSLRLFLVRLKLFIQEFVLHQALQLVTQSYTSLNFSLGTFFLVGYGARLEFVLSAEVSLNLKARDQLPSFCLVCPESELLCFMNITSLLIWATTHHRISTNTIMGVM